MFDTLIRSLRFNRPWWLYESAPYLYIAIGVMVHAQLSGLLANLSGALLILAGANVLYMRWSYRRGKAGASAMDLTPLPLHLDSACQYDHAVIDAEHRELFIAAHALVKAMPHAPADEFDLLVGDLIRQNKHHFAVEEGFLRQADPAIARWQREEHAALAVKIDTLHAAYQAGRVKRHELIECVVYEAIVEHTKQDKAIFEKAFWG